MQALPSVAEVFLRPRSVALVGASGDVSKFGGRLLRHLLKWGFPGTVHVVHPRASELMGVPCVPSLAGVPSPVDLVVVALPRERVPGVVAECSKVQARGLIVFTSGYAETGAEGEHAQAELVALVRQHGLRLLGPNCLGLYNAHYRLALSANEVLNYQFTPGPVALVSQSGALVGSMLDRGAGMGIHFAGFVNTGNEADLDAADFLECFAHDPRVRILLAYVEGTKDWSRFIAALDAAAAADKPVIVLKAGRTARGRRAVRSHTGVLAGDAELFDALLRKKGAHGVQDVEEALDLALLFSRFRPPARPGIAMVSDSGGLASLAADRCEVLGLSVPDFAPGTVESLRKALPEFATAQNPLDVTGASTSSVGLLEQCLDLVAHDESVGLVLLLLTMGYGHERLATEVLRAREGTSTPFIAVWCGGELLRPDRERLREGGLVVYETVGSALHAMRAFLGRSRWRESSAQPARCPFTDVQFSIARSSLNAVGSRWLTEYESKKILSAFGLSVTRERLAKDAEEAASIAGELGYPVALKVMSPDILHKTQVGGIALGVRSAEEVRYQAREILEVCAKRAPGAQIQGILVQEMLDPRLELIIGALRTREVGPVVMVGLGGCLAEALRDVTFRLAPVNQIDAEQMLTELRVSRALFPDGRGVGDVVDLVVRVSWLVSELEMVREFDINPLVLTRSDSCVVLDALMRIGPAGGQAGDGGHAD